MEVSRDSGNCCLEPCLCSKRDKICFRRNYVTWTLLCILAHSSLQSTKVIGSVLAVNGSLELTTEFDRLRKIESTISKTSLSSSVTVGSVSMEILYSLTKIGTASSKLPSIKSSKASTSLLGEVSSPMCSKLTENLSTRPTKVSYFNSEILPVFKSIASHLGAQSSIQTSMNMMPLLSNMEVSSEKPVASNIVLESLSKISSTEINLSLIPGTLATTNLSYTSQHELSVVANTSRNLPVKPSILSASDVSNSSLETAFVVVTQTQNYSSVSLTSSMTSAAVKSNSSIMSSNLVSTWQNPTFTRTSRSLSTHYNIISIVSTAIQNYSHSLTSASVVQNYSSLTKTSMPLVNNSGTAFTLQSSSSEMIIYNITSTSQAINITTTVTVCPWIPINFTAFVISPTKSNTLPPAVPSSTIFNATSVSPPLFHGCKVVLTGLSDVMAGMTSCILKHLRPLKVCEKCTKEYTQMMEYHGLVYKDCYKELIDEYNAQYQAIPKMYGFQESVWNTFDCESKYGIVSCSLDVSCSLESLSCC